MTETKYDVFISYSSRDLDLAQPIAEKLAGEGFRVWFDKARLNPGCKWHDEIEAGVESSRIVLPILTPRWKESEWTKFETYAAETIIPLVLDGSWEEISAPPLQEHQSSAIAMDQSQESWDRLVQAIRDHLAKPLPAKAERIAYLRYSPNSCFVGREKDLVAIHEALFENPTAALTQGKIQALAAMGGVGKTTLAREYAERFWRLYPQMFWVDAREDVAGGYANIARILFPALANETNEQMLAERALLELNGRTRRLLILDNVEDEKSIMRWLPKNGACHTIITSRFTDWTKEIRTHRIWVLDPEPARELILKRAEREAAAPNLAAADKLASLLGYLPLALEQAAAFINVEGPAFAIDDYVELYEQDTQILLNQGVLGSTQYPDSVYTTWNATSKKLSPLARAILKCSAFLAPEPIPFGLFTADLEAFQNIVAVMHENPDPAKKLTALAVRLARQELAKYSLITNVVLTPNEINLEPGKDSEGFKVHALVQTVEMIDSSAEHKTAVSEAFPEMAYKYVPGTGFDFETWPTWKIFSPHMEAIYAISGGKHTATIATLCAYHAGFLQECMAQYSMAQPLFQKALEIREKVLGPEHPGVASSLTGLAMLYYRQGDLDGAFPLMKRALEIDEKVFGPEHPAVATSLSNLALLYEAPRHRGKMVLETLEKLEAKLDTQQVQGGGLAFWHKMREDLAEKLSLNERALKITEKVLGPEHPSVATSLNNLAEVYRSLEDLPQALPLFKRALEIYEKTRRPQNPKFATSLKNLSLLYEELGDLSEALPLIKRALEIEEKVLGPEHPELKQTKDSLKILEEAVVNKPKIDLINKGDFYRQREQLDLAISCYEEALSLDHKDVRLLTKLGDSYHKKGDRAKAIKTYSTAASCLVEDGFFSRAFAIYKQIIGIDPSNFYAQERLGEHDRAMFYSSKAAEINSDNADFANDVSDMTENHPSAEESWQDDYGSDSGPEKDADDDSIKKSSKEELVVEAEVWLKYGLRDKAISHLTRALELNQKDVQVLMKLGKIYDEKNSTAKAVAVYKQVIQIDPNHLDALEKLAALYYELGLNEAFLTLYRRLFALLETSGDIGRAIHYLQQALALNPENESLVNTFSEVMKKYPTAEICDQNSSGGSDGAKDNSSPDPFGEDVNFSDDEDAFTFPEDDDFSFTSEESATISPPEPPNWRMVACDQCGFQSKLEEENITTDGVSVRCSNCKNIFRVMK